MEHQRELNRQSDRLFLAPVIRIHPLGCFGIEDHIYGERGEPSLNISGCGGLISGYGVAPVSLAVYEKVLLAHLNQRLFDGGVTVRMVLHGLTHNGGNLYERTVIYTPHCVENTALNGLESVFYVRHRTVQNNV